MTNERRTLLATFQHARLCALASGSGLEGTVGAFRLVVARHRGVNAIKTRLARHGKALARAPIAVLRVDGAADVHATANRVRRRAWGAALEGAGDFNADAFAQKVTARVARMARRGAFHGRGNVRRRHRRERSAADEEKHRQTLAGQSRAAHPALGGVF